VNQSTFVCDCYFLSSLGWYFAFVWVKSEKLGTLIVDNLKKTNVSIKILYLKGFSLRFRYYCRAKKYFRLFYWTSGLRDRYWGYFQIDIISILNLNRYSLIDWYKTWFFRRIILAYGLTCLQYRIYLTVLLDPNIHSLTFL